MPVRAVLLGGRQRKCYIRSIKGFELIPGIATMKSLCLASLLTIAVVQQAVAVVGSPPKIDQPQAEPVYYYYHGGHYPYRYHGHYFNHRAWHAGHWRYY